MELFLIILRNIFISLAIIYVLLIIISVSFVFSFASILSHHNHDLTMILTSKRDNLIALANLLNKASIKFDKSRLEALNNFDLRRIENQDDDEAGIAREELTSLCDYFLNINIEIEALINSEEYQRIITNISELEKVYRDHLMMYNADVLGYNFWINFLPTRFIFKIFRQKKKKTI